MIRIGSLLFIVAQSCIAPLGVDSDCLSICDRTGSVCQAFDTIACYDHCETLTPRGVTSYGRCAECYVTIACDNSRYALLCYPSCSEY